MVQREAAGLLKKMQRQFRAIAIVGPRQSGKTTLAKMVFHDKPIISFENPSTRNYFNSDPNGFLEQYKNGAVFDEAQRVPELFSYLQQIIDESNQKSRFILTGSNNFLLQHNITQSLAGRIGYLDLLPFSINEIRSISRNAYADKVNDYIFRGGYPEVASKKMDYHLWFSSYIRTYIERDIRQLKNIENLAVFEKLIMLCAGRVGQQLNMTNLSIETGLNVNTVQSWLGLLQSSYIIYLLKPHHKNYNKRVVKTPKLYFYDTGLASQLLGIQKPEELNFNTHKGALFENLMINEMLKARFNNGKRNNLYYWRDNTGHEVDVLIEEGDKLIPVEFKSGATVNEDFFKGLFFWQELTKNKRGILVYGGEEDQHRSNGIEVMSWNKIGDL